jgi:hypothetical protein
VRRFGLNKWHANCPNNQHSNLNTGTLSMKIQNPQAVVQHLDPLGARRADQPLARPTEKQLKSDDGDALDVSLSARMSELSKQIATELSDTPAELTPERAVQIQSRIGTGFYSLSETATATVEQLIGFYGR